MIWYDFINFNDLTFQVISNFKAIGLCLVGLAHQVAQDLTDSKISTVDSEEEVTEVYAAECFIIIAIGLFGFALVIVITN